MREEYFKDFYQENKRGRELWGGGEIDGVGRDDENFLTLFSFWDEKKKKKKSKEKHKLPDLLFRNDFYLFLYLPLGSKEKSCKTNKQLYKVIQKSM